MGVRLSVKALCFRTGNMMTSIPKPNLFTFATSELSQDAFIAWLLAWADPGHARHDVALHGTAALLLDRLLTLCGIPRPNIISSVMVQRQYKKIDVVVVINGRIAIGIEDKVQSSEHSNQLQRYQMVLRDAFDPQNIGAVYLKTGDQGSYEKVEEAGYVRFSRSDFLAALRSGLELGLRNEIVLEFITYLETWNATVDGFRTAPLDQWNKDRRRWIGFFLLLERHLSGVDWKFVPNKSGGFMGLWWHWRGNRYLQLEGEKLCFKIQVEKEDDRRAEWEALHAVLMQKQTRFPLSLKRPRFKSGKWMTVALLSRDYRATNEAGLFDLDGTLATLHLAEHVLDVACE